MSSVEAYSKVPLASGYRAIAAVDQTVLESMPTAVCVCSAAGALVRFNQRAVALWGRTPRPGETGERYCGAFRVYTLDGTPLLHAGTPMEAALRTGEPQRDQELVLERPDGSRAIVLMNIDVLRNDAGVIEGAVNCFQDITARKQEEQLLREKEQRSRQILDVLPAAIYTTDAEGTLTYFNPAAAELAGNAPVIGKDKWCVSWRLRRPDGTVLPHDECPMAITLKEGRPVRDVEAFAERPDGTLIPFAPYPTPMFDASGALTGAVNMLVDLTERKQAAERETGHLRQAEQAAQRLASIVEFSEDAIVSKNLDGVIATWNKGAERLFGYTSDEVIGKSVTILIPADHRDEEPGILKRIRAGERIEHYETIRQHKDGRLIDISLTVSPVRDNDGRVVGASKIARNITERKRAERALVRHMTEQAALYEFTERLHRATSVEDVYESALDAIGQALGCSRASILLFDESRARCASSPGAVCRTATGRPSTVIRHGLPTHAIRWPSTLTTSLGLTCLTRSRRSSRPKASAPSRSFRWWSASKLIGKFMTYYEMPHAFDEGETELALTIARQLGFSLQRMRVEDALRDSEQRLQMALKAGRMGAWEWDVASGKVVWSPGLEELHGMQPGAFGGTFEDFKRDMHPDDVARAETQIRQAIETRQDYHLVYRIKRPDGTLRWLESFGRFAPDAKRTSPKLAGVCMDISERKQAEAQRDLLVAELSHRVKNTLATVVSIARQSFATNPDADEAQRSFNARIRALGQTHSRLAEANWSGVSLETVLLDELAPYRHEDGANFAHRWTR